MLIKIETRNVYGEIKAYPVCDHARTFAAIAGTKTLTRATLRGVHDLGFAIEVMNGASTSYTIHPQSADLANALLRLTTT